MKAKRTKLEKFISEIDPDVLKCPLGVTNAKKHVEKIKPHLQNILSLSKKDLQYLNKYIQSHCKIQNAISAVTTVNVTSVCQDIKVAINYLQNKINKSPKPALLVIGEYHVDTRSFLMGISILNYLKTNKLSSKLLIEFDSTGVNNYKYYHISSFLSLDVRNVAYSVLNYDLLGVDKYHGHINRNAEMSVSEESMIKEIERITEKSKDTVTVATVGYEHLGTLKKLENNKNFNVILLNTANATQFERELSLINDHETKQQVTKRFQKIDLIPVFDFRENVRALSLEQVFDIFQTCQNTETSKSQIVAKGLTECAMLDISKDLIGCDILQESDEL